MTAADPLDRLHVLRSMDDGSLRISLRMLDALPGLVARADVSGSPSRARHDAPDGWMVLSRTPALGLRATASLPGETRWTMSDRLVADDGGDLRDPAVATRLLGIWRRLAILPDLEPDRQGSLLAELEAAADRAVSWWRADAAVREDEGRRSFAFRWTTPLLPSPAVEGHYVGANELDAEGNAAIAAHPALRAAPRAVTLVVDRGLRVATGHSHRTAVGAYDPVEAMRALADPLLRRDADTIP